MANFDALTTGGKTSAQPGEEPCSPAQALVTPAPGGPRPGGSPARAENRFKRLLRQPVCKQLARIVVSVVLLALLFHQLNVQDVLANLRKLSWGLILFAWGYYAFCQLLSSWRWQLFLKVKGIHVPIWDLFSFYLIGMFLNNFLPGAVGGDVVKTYYVYQETRQAKYAVSSVFLERFTGLLGLSLLSLAGLAVGFHQLHSPLILGAVVGTAVFLLGTVLLLWWPPLSAFMMRLLGRSFPRGIGDKLQHLYAALAGYREYRKTLLVAIGLSVVIQCLYALFYALVSQGLGTPISVLYFILFLPLVTVVSMVPISFGGLGIREALMVLLFGSVGVAAADVVSVSLTAYFLNTLLSLAGGVLFLRRRPVTPRLPEGGDV